MKPLVERGADMAPQALVQVRREGRVLLITMQREHKRNAVDRALADALDVAFNTLEDDPELFVGVLTGGDKIFCAGSDLTSGGDYVTERGGEYGIIRRRRRKPLIAAVEGAALGGGMEIVLACDLLVAADNARFGLPEVVRGVLPTCGALFRALHALPPNIARELVLTGEPMDAVRAHALGLVNVLAPPGDSLAGALAMAHRIAANAPLSVQACLGAMNGLLAVNDAHGWDVTAAALAAIAASDDVQEGLRAFLEKRAPVWMGR
ncbi:enoyl-CoA hydratase-related protein [Janthinobacterium sp. PC23-8]|uniref:enoyl-CoA hydratase-related protein n=1 Tax=Janthinobacterium sp. PC23-8 TaxID=2012679 RepID=UPI001C3CF9DD|nr:enoyl-CoA hydratase-related protein [Janthinobacterium sp. PC23-8]